ncbi:carboxyesterase-related protein [Chrysochromulina tobinii]|uniref:Carboxyesterase-related protein n=1 Tax=Chrysochromulina tobinii TaxID=1460289 RepID=A0A0M0KB32_9EUKA|nr:carboxyesterase-related protein [Chrysochromulina tobinii]|eukprot:KOO36040.1 carboxyesterase-related protein [Chrysochromulina sp. CCMP291]
MLFVVLLLPGFLPHAFRYFFTSPHVWASSYGDSVRHRLDVYVPLGPNGEPLATKEGAAVPIVVFVTGGAWIIGYRMWGFLLGFALQKHGVICICVDYRNFPQARIPQMIDDVSDALDWVYEHASTLGGSPDDITLVGQSAGAHLSAMVLLRIMRQRKDATSRPPLRRFVGISGPYDMPKIKPSLSKPDQTVPWEQSHDFAMRLRACGAYSVTERYYENKSHTDPIVEDPLCGGDVLLADLLDMVLGPADRTAELKAGLWPSMLPAPRWLFPLAKRINPF